MNVAAIVGGAAGGVVAGGLCICLALCICVAVCVCYQKKKAKTHATTATSTTRVTTVQPAPVAIVSQVPFQGGQHGTQPPQYNPDYVPTMQHGYPAYPATNIPPTAYPTAAGGMDAPTYTTGSPPQQPYPDQPPDMPPPYPGAYPFTAPQQL